MGQIDLGNEDVTVKPDAGETTIFVDPITKKIKTRDDADLVVDYTPIGKDWEVPGAGTIDPSNYADNDTVYTHPNHSGEVTSIADGAQVIAPTAISNKTLKAVPSGTEEVLINDAGTLKKTTAQAIANLGGGGGAGIENPVDTTWKIRRNELSQGDGNHFWGELPLYGAASTGASIAELALGAGDENRVGLIRVSGGTTYASLMSSLQGASIRFGDADHRFGASVKLINVPDVTDDYRAWCGYSLDFDSIGSYMSVIGIDRALSTTNYVCFTRRGGVQTTVVTSVAIDTNWHNMEVVVNAANTSHTYYIDGVLVATITTNLPDASLATIAFIENVAGASRSFDMDWIYQAWKPATARGVIHTWIS